MDVIQIYAFKDAQTFNVFMQQNRTEFVVREIRIVPIVTGDAVLVMHYIIAEVKWMMCEELWERYTQLVGKLE